MSIKARIEKHPALADRVRPKVQRAIRNTPGRRVRWGSFKRTKPFSECYGWDRGTPIDRWYIERYLESTKQYIHGDAMEIRDPAYVNRFGGSRVDKAHVVDIDADNPRADLVADLCVPESLPSGAYDSVVLTQTFHLLADEQVALDNLWNSLKPGGTLIITAPCLSRVDHEIPEVDFWRYTPRGFEQRLQLCLPADAKISVEGHGNALSGAAFFLGLAAEELDESDLAVDDPFFPITCCARVEKPS
ncbi:MAG: methyltransferase domain-containing protein [Thermoleophilaceae bacterium]|nr:methyltransferase domain-containing protein [Thermoleophilaceae bacterium]